MYAENDIFSIAINFELEIGEEFQSLQQQAMKTDIWGFKTQGQLYHKYRPGYPPQLCERAIEPLHQKKRYLDIGVGTGKTLFLFCDSFEESTGIDVSEGMLTVARSNAQEYMKSHPNNKIKIEKMGVQDLKQEGEKFDLITAGQALFYFPGEEPLRKIRSRLNKGGIFIALSYHLSGLEDPQDDVFFKEYWNKIVTHFAFNINDLASHYTDPIKYPLDEVFDKVQRDYANHYQEMTKEDFILSMRTYAACNIYQAKTGEDPTIALAAGIKSDKIVFRYQCSRIRCYKLSDD